MKKTDTMKKHSFLFALAFPFLVSCTPITSPTTEDSYQPAAVGSYAYGADCSWITEEEADGVLF
ncbi:MAG: hypothetical protein ACI4UO_03405, partial [Paludibacteraceae bacterium]